MSSAIVIPIIISAIALLVGVIFSIVQSSLSIKQLIIQNEQLKVQNDQIKTDLFAEYTKRYQEIILKLPYDIESVKFKFSNNTKEREVTISYLRVYFDLCAEEYFLNENRRIEDKVWQEWLQGMKYMINKPAFKQVWIEYYKNSEYYSNFKVFVEREIIGQ